MTIWNHCEMSTLDYSDAAAEKNHPCVVKINDDAGLQQYRGPNDGSGHFLLTALSLACRSLLGCAVSPASLHWIGYFAWSAVCQGCSGQDPEVT